MNTYKQVNSYDEAVQVIKQVGFLPLATLIPNHPSLGSITNSTNWHTGSSMDPWLWRVRFPGLLDIMHHQVNVMLMD